jgi:hypothetical protein
LTFVGKNKPHSRVLSGFVVGQIKYEAKFNPVKGAIYALYDMKICLILAKRVIYDVFSIRTEKSWFEGLFIQHSEWLSKSEPEWGLFIPGSGTKYPRLSKQNKREKILLICRRSAESLCRETPDRFYISGMLPIKKVDYPDRYTREPNDEVRG